MWERNKQLLLKGILFDNRQAMGVRVLYLVLIIIRKELNLIILTK